MSLLRRYFPRTYLARRNLLRARTRTVLAILTVAIGVVAVGGLGVFGLAFEADQQATLGDLGNEVRVEAPQQFFSEDDAPELDDRRLEEIREITGDTEMTVIRESERDFGGGGGGEIDIPTYALGVTNPKSTYTVVEGEIPDDWNRGALIDQQTAQFEELSIGDPVTVGGRLQRVTAIIEQPQGFSSLERTNGAAVLPLDLVEPGDQPYRGVIIYADNAVEADEIANDLEAELNGPLRQDQDQFTIESTEEEAETVEQQFTSTNRFLLAVGSISLLIAGISITNVQLMSARERRTEIGVLRAVGYGRLDILAIMLIEALFMGLVAAIVGVGLTLGAGAVINDVLLGDPMAFQPDTLQYLGGAFAFGIAICILAGIVPAWKASRERPADALGS
ncbi:putative ABC transport system permease protein [Halovenus aranensis]|uniref:Putative ABC transport system permease protein n=1 Tax=Halovenus aranensis TaxID=890420 RepID=A0A1G8S1T1_9EURY|nr:ABC transporter permease [Halovenus aranensis]SDJ23197.1 putative ABC transport system permease protein [Halovenus aranensis]